MTDNRKHQTLKEKLADSHYQPTKEEMERDVSISATPETLVNAVTKSGVPRREPPS